MTDSISAGKFIRSRGLNHRQLKAFRDEIESEYGDILYYWEVLWLSKGKVLQCFVSLLEEMKVLLTGKDNQSVVLKMIFG
jgi:hypothetical protein